MARKQKELIKAASIATAIDKVTGEVLGWSVKSNSSSKYYQVRSEIIDDARVFFCDCEAHLWGYSECCHIKAIQEVLAAKAEQEVEAQEKHEAAIKQALAARLTAESIAYDRREGGHKAFNAVKDQVATINRYGCLFDEKGYEAHNYPEFAGQKLIRKETKRMPQLTSYELSKRGFAMVSIPELGGRMVPLKVA